MGRSVGLGVEFDTERAGLYDRIRSFTVDRVGLRILVTHDTEEAVLLSDYVTVLSGVTPTAVVDTIEVGIGRARTAETMTDPAFRSAVARIWDALESSTR